MSMKLHQVTDQDGTRHLVDAAGVRYLTEEHPGHWYIAIAATGWHGWRDLAQAVLAVPADASGPQP